MKRIPCRVDYGGLRSDAYLPVSCVTQRHMGRVQAVHHQRAEHGDEEQCEDERHPVAG